MQEILGRVVPGFATPNTDGSAGPLPPRGRDPLNLIDGVPIATNTNCSRFLDRFDPLGIGRIEVVYGPTSLYGAGATGGVIQFSPATRSRRTAVRLRHAGALLRDGRGRTV